MSTQEELDDAAFKAGCPTCGKRSRSHAPQFWICESGCPDWPRVIAAEACYYIIDARTIAGNCAMLWCPDRQGYTCDVSKAGLYTKAQAESEHAQRATDIPIHRDRVRPYLVTHLRRDSLSSADPEFAAHMQAAHEDMHPVDANDLSESDLKHFLEIDPFEGDRDAWGCTTLRDTIVTGAKEHKCTECSGTIRKGLRHRCKVETEPGQPATSYRWCPDCTREHLLSAH